MSDGGEDEVFDRFKLKGLDRIEDARSRDGFGMLSLRAALAYQGFFDAESKRNAVEAWNDALICGLIDC